MATKGIIGGDGKTNHLKASVIADIFDNGGSWSVWIRVESDGEADAGRIYQKSGRGAVRVEVAGASGIQMTQTFSGANGVWNTDDEPLTYDVWHHLVINYDSDDVNNNPTIFTDTSSSVINEANTPTGTRSTDESANLVLFNAGGNTRDFDGEMYYFCWSNAELTTNEIAILSRGVNPFIVNHSSITMLDPLHGDLTGQNATRNITGGESGLITGTLTQFAGNPPVEMLENYL